MKQRDLAFKKSITTKLYTDNVIFKSFTNKVVSKIRKAKTAYFMHLMEESGGNSSCIWKHIGKTLTKTLEA